MDGGDSPWAGLKIMTALGVDAVATELVEAKRA
jgi:hypothetical protein